MSEAAGVVLRAGLVLTVTGVSRCIGFDSYAAVTIAPSMLGVGAAVAVDAPISVEACSVGKVAMVDDIEYKIEGRGVGFSSPQLLDALAALAVAACHEDSDDVTDLLRRLAEDPLYPYETVVASLRGSSLVVGRNVFPLDALRGYWAVVVRLHRRLNTSSSLLAVAERRRLRELMFEFTEDGIEPLRRLGLELARTTGRRAERLVRRALSAGAEAAFIDMSGSILVAVAEWSRVGVVSKELRGVGTRYEAAIIA